MNNWWCCFVFTKLFWCFVLKIFFGFNFGSVVSFYQLCNLKISIKLKIVSSRRFEFSRVINLTNFIPPYPNILRHQWKGSFIFFERCKGLQIHRPINFRSDGSTQCESFFEYVKVCEQMIFTSCFKFFMLQQHRADCKNWELY